MSDDTMTRRRFIETGICVITGAIAIGIGGAALTSIGAPAITNRREGKWIEAAKAEELVPEQFNRVSILYDAKDGWLEGKIKQLVYVKLIGEEVLALSATCSHLGCNVNYDEQSGGFKCPCHSGVYDASGKNISGPPPKPLTRLEAKIEDGKLFINTAIKEA
ncbi:MAG: ubiquinol-cytochrome c reductase iron-sulfur subunit [Thermodesulfovibrionales bacterium]